jgi:hypothetical protein
LLRGARLVGQILDPIIELGEAIDGFGRHQVLTRTRPILDENEVDFSVR